MRNRVRSGRLELHGPLPVLGPAHPLRKTATRLLCRSVLFTSLLFFAGPAASLLVGHFRPEVVPRVPSVPGHRYEPMPPPSIKPTPGSPAQRLPEVVWESVGVPEPVADLVADFSTLTSAEDFIDLLAGPAYGDFDPARDTLAIDLPEPERLPAPHDFVPVEVEPALIELPAPVYPEIARMAGVEGTVVVRVLVGAKGNVLDAVLLEGPVMLRDAALFAARGALYRPALQQNHPVPVWVLQRITFRLD